MKGHLGCAELLLGHPGVDVDCRDSKCETLLLTACSKPVAKESVRLLELFIKNGADINASDLQGRTPVRAALKMVTNRKSRAFQLTLPLVQSFFV